STCLCYRIYGLFSFAEYASHHGNEDGPCDRLSDRSGSCVSDQTTTSIKNRPPTGVNGQQEISFISPGDYWGQSPSQPVFFRSPHRRYGSTKGGSTPLLIVFPSSFLPLGD